MSRSFAVRCCAENCDGKGYVAHELVPEKWDSHWYCAAHRGETQFVPGEDMSVLRITPTDEDRAEAARWSMHFNPALSEKDTVILAGIIAAVRADEREKVDAPGEAAINLAAEMAQCHVVADGVLEFQVDAAAKIIDKKFWFAAHHILSGMIEGMMPVPPLPTSSEPENLAPGLEWLKRTIEEA